MTSQTDRNTPVTWDHSTHEKFYEYYAEESVTEASLGRFRRIRDRILAVAVAPVGRTRALDVADIGCGAGTQSMVWAEAGHNVHAVDINEPLLDLGRTRAAAAGHNIDFRVGSATALPWGDNSMDVCVALELLEHVSDWESCLRESMRVLRPGGALFFTTTNVLCPVQAEFRLPMYSWYPARLKRHYEHLAITTRPEIANFARYPAVHWFSYRGFEKLLTDSGFRCMDRFDLIDTQGRGTPAKIVVSAVRNVSLLRWFGHVCTPGTTVLAVKGTNV